MLCYAMLCYTILHYATLYYTVLHYTTIHDTKLHYDSPVLGPIAIAPTAIISNRCQLDLLNVKPY